jgi:hypothetical protein
MPQRINSPRYWRSNAEDTLRIAEQMKEPESKRLLMGVAATYMELARRAAGHKGLQRATVSNRQAPSPSYSVRVAPVEVGSTQKVKPNGSEPRDKGRTGRLSEQSFPRTPPTSSASK